ncbi:alternate-type signal peptide domain-containing protein [Ruania suaedae]|uniref:alternate-type signal peptide domain-containing protein n=1 Tax=Ruania suaedae TaxID=2897774 RepID=UPI001E53C95B|nr:alternate-type signal peptide domain-containing protein [Ruania suaedae]UFU03293.1 alternate-type signal peptide domain-containing protein [Ruania suaedae]
MKKTTTGLLAGAAGAALLLGGTTFALWSDSEDIDGGTITAGTLDVALLGDPVWEDISEDRTDAGHEIDLSTFRIVPGDVIQGRYAVDVALQGENMVAAFGITGDEGQTGTLLDGLEVVVEVEDETGTVVASGTGAGVDLNVNLASDDNGNNDPALPTVPVALDGTANHTVVVTVTFDEDTDEQELALATATLEGLSVTLDQVRDAGAGGGF